MNIELKKLSLSDGKEIYEMLKEIGPGENGFINSGYEINYREFDDYLLKNDNYSKGIGLEPQYVPQTTYWLYADGVPVGVSKLRDHLTDALRKVGGHIGYCIRPSQRGKGYGNIILKKTLEEAKKKNITEVLITCHNGNIPSRRVIEANGGVLQDIIEGRCRYWIKLEM